MVIHDDWVITGANPMTYPLVAIENGPLIVDLPRKNGGFPVHYVNVETRG